MQKFDRFVPVLKTLSDSYQDHKTVGILKRKPGYMHNGLFRKNE